MALVNLKFYSHYLGMEMPMSVLLPDRRFEDASRKDRYPVLYLLHGFAADETSWIRMTEVEQYAKYAEVIIVMPCIHRSFCINAVHGLRYEDYMAEEVPYVVHEFFHASERREDQYIAGASMGGYGALKLGLNHPEAFGHIAAMSAVTDCYEKAEAVESRMRIPDFRLFLDGIFGGRKAYYGSGNDLYALADQLQERTDVLKPEVFLSCGKSDFLYEENQKFADYLAHHTGLRVSFRSQEGDHSWKFWNRDLPEVLAAFGFIRK
ncbi:MAG: alpha/beta hydrolase [Bulleidia sp.]